MPGNTLGSNDVPLSLFGGLNTELSPVDLPEGASPDCQDVAFLPGSVFNRPALRVIYQTPLPNNVSVNYAKTFVQGNGIPLTLFLAGDGRFYQEDTVNDPGNYSLVGTTTPNLLATSFTGFDTEFISFHDGYHGQEIPRQYNGQLVDRVSQDAPGDNTIIASDLTVSLGLSIFSQGVGIVGVSQNGFTVTLTTLSAHGFYPGQTITVDGSFLSNVNGTFIITDTPTATTLTYTNTISQSAGASGGGVAYMGPYANVLTATEAANIVTLTLDRAHGFSVGQQIAVANVSVSGYNGIQAITAVPTATTLTYTLAATGLAGATGGQAMTLNATVTAGGTLGVAVGDALTFSGGASGIATVTKLLTANAVEIAYGSGFNIPPITTGTVAPGGKISAGIHQFVVMFLTRNGYITAPSPIKQWTSGGNKQVTMTNIPRGPDNVTARIIAFTPTAGDNFFYIPIDSIGGLSTVIPDNTATTATFNFSDNTLMASIAIDDDGNNLFNQVVLAPNAGGIVYADRTFWWGERNKVQNFVNMGFDGGANFGNILGWKVNTFGGFLVAMNGFLAPEVQPDSGLAWTIAGDGTNNPLGQLEQTAFQDQFGINILTPNKAYTFSCWAKVSFLSSAGSIVATLTSPATGYTAKATIPVSAIATAGGFVQADFDSVTPITIPSDLVLQVHTQGTADGMLLTLDELELFPTDQPFAETQVRVSYVNNPEAFDDVTGKLIVGSANGQPVRHMFTLRDSLYVVKSNSIYTTQDNGQEPATWQISTVSTTVGALSNRAVDVGDDWAVIAARGGLYIFSGGDPVKVSQEIQSLWDRINWSAAKTIWVKVDDLARRIYVGVPLDEATSPSVLLVLDYRELNSSADVQSGSPIHISYTGKMLASDLSRKWTIWNISVNCGDLVLRNGGLETLVLGGGNGIDLSGAFGNLYSLDPNKYTDDDFGQINSYYTTYFYINHEMEQQLQTGSHRKLFIYLSLFISGIGQVVVTPVVDRIGNNKRTTKPRTLSQTPVKDAEWPVNVKGERVAFRITPQPVFGPNLISDSDGLNGTFAISGAGLVFNPTAGANEGGGWQFIGNGNASSFSFAVSKIIPVIGGMTYTLSGYIDASQVSAGTLLPIWEVTDPPLLNTFASVQQQAGANGRVQVSFTIPVGVSQVVVLCDTFNCVVSDGGVLTFSNPQLELGSNATAYTLRDTDNGFSLNKMVVTLRQDPQSPVRGGI